MGFQYEAAQRYWPEQVLPAGDGLAGDFVSRTLAHYLTSRRHSHRSAHPPHVLRALFTLYASCLLFISAQRHADQLNGTGFQLMHVCVINCGVAFDAA